MAASYAAERYLERLETRIEEEVRGADGTVLAFSAGLGSTLVAAIARKRGVLRCAVAGAPGAPDVRAAQIAASYLDYAIIQVSVDAARARSLAGDTERRFPRLRRADARAVVPALAARDAARVERILVGFGGSRLGREMEKALGGLGLIAPLAEASREPVGRTRLAACAALLGLPPAFARPRRRPPLVGAGLEAAFGP